MTPDLALVQQRVADLQVQLTPLRRPAATQLPERPAAAAALPANPVLPVSGLQRPPSDLPVFSGLWELLFSK